MQFFNLLMIFLVFFERGEYTLGIFIDLSKAFDTVDHEILISKLQYYGIKGKTLKWLKTYLSEQK